MMLDKIPERLKTAAEGVAKATQMMADAKSARNGDGANYRGLTKEQTAEWQAAEMIERYETAMQEAVDLLLEKTFGNDARSPGHNARLKLEAALKGHH